MLLPCSAPPLVRCFISIWVNCTPFPFHSIVQRLQYATKYVSLCYYGKWEPRIASVSRDQHWDAMWNLVMSVFHTYLHSCNTESSCTGTKPHGPKGLAVGRWAATAQSRGPGPVLSPSCPLPTTSEHTARFRTRAAALHHQLKPLSRLRTLSFNEVPWVHLEHEHYIADSDSK